VTLKKVTVPDSGQDPNIVYTQNWNDFVDAFTPVEQKSHLNTLDHSNASDHSHTNKTLLDTYTQTEADVADAVSKKHADHESPLDHEHANKTLLDSYTQTETDVADAVTKKHSNNLDHSNSLDHDGSAQNTAIAGKEPANSNIQTHVSSTHAPSDAQKNSDITKAEIEAKLTGEIASHSHAAGGGGLGYSLSVQALTSSPADSVSAYFGQLPKAPTTTANISKVYVRKAGTITMANIYCYSGTAGTSESWSLYIRLNNSSDTLIATLAVSTSERVFTNSNLSIAVAAGDYFEIKSVQPAWATNPLTTIYGGYVYIE